MTGIPTRRMGLLLGVLALAGCAEGQMPGFLKANDGADGTAAAASETAVVTVERDVEAPEVFQVAAKGLWDGRPSLGGVWVAYADVAEPERVIIRNTGNGQFVIGALFRRERLNPGPPIQVSSDAAAALGMLAGAPAPLEVTALRRAEVPVTPPQPDPVPEATDAAASGSQTGAITAKPIDEVTNAAAAAIDSAEGKEVRPKAQPARLGAAPAETAAPAASAATAPAKPAQTSASHPRPFLQIGIFSVEANAGRAGNRLRSRGVVPTIRKEDSRGKTFWRVIVGPAHTSDDRDEILKKARDAGFSDAYFVKN